MKKGIVYFTLLLSIVACSADQGKKCQSSDALQNVIAQWEKSEKLSDSGVQCESIESFPKRFDKDSHKSGVLYKLNFDEGTIVIKEYSFSVQFVKEHAMEATLVEFLQDDPQEFAYSRSMNVDSSGCLIISIKSEKEAKALRKYADELLKQYVKNIDI